MMISIFGGYSSHKISRSTSTRQLNKAENELGL